MRSRRRLINVTIDVKVILDSVAPNGVRLTTFELTYPRFIHSELMTHRVFSRNAASSRAVPTKKKIERIRQDMAMPVEWGVNQKGMQAAGPLPPEEAALAERLWREAGAQALEHAEYMIGVRCHQCGWVFAEADRGKETFTCSCSETVKLDLHKQVANRIIEPWDHITVVLSTTKLANHRKLRTEIDKQTGRPLPDPTYFELATKMHAAADASTPYKVLLHDWHLPYVYRDTLIDGVTIRDMSDEDADAINGDLSVAKKVSVGRCARVSYLRQGQGDIEENIKLHDRLLVGHWAPFEHVATPIDCEFRTYDEPFKCHCGRRDTRGAYIGLNTSDKYIDIPLLCSKCAIGHVTSGNFVGWAQYRKEFLNEAGGDIL